MIGEDAFDVIVVGAGIAGLTAARETASLGLSTACIEALMFGGLIVNINELDPAVPGAPDSGVDFASELMMRAVDGGVTSIADTVISIERSEGSFGVVCAEGRQNARSVILASGASLKRLGIPGEEEFENRGISHCADCDGPFYAGQDVVVVGGGDSALQEALVLAKYCRHVHLVHRREQFSARASFVDAIAACGNVSMHWNSVLEEIQGDAQVSTIVVHNTADRRLEHIACTGLFAFIGLEPNLAYLPLDVARDPGGRAIADAALQTAWPGMFAAGAVRSGCGGLLADAVADGLLAAASAGAFVRAPA